MPDSTWTTDPVYQKQGGEYAYYQNDHLGTPQRLVKGSGETVWEGRYRGFGEEVAQDGGWVNLLRFAGQYEDGETGAFYNYFRDYSPEVGRYAQRDPIGLGGGVNIYEYVEGSPVSVFDAHGLRGRRFDASRFGSPYGKPLPPNPNAKSPDKLRDGLMDRDAYEGFENAGEIAPGEGFSEGDRWGTPALPSDCYLGWLLYQEWSCVRYRYEGCTGKLVKYWKLIIVNTNTAYSPHGTCILRKNSTRPLHPWPGFQCPKSRPIYRDSEQHEGPSMWSAED